MSAHALAELRTLAWLAGAIAGRKMAVTLSSREDHRPFTQGHTISLTAEAPHWHAVAAQASLVAAGSFDPALLARLVGRRGIAKRYLYLEVRRAARHCADRLPLAFCQLEALRGDATGSARESLAAAAGSQAIPEPPIWFGVIRPLQVLLGPGADATAAGKADIRQHADDAETMEDRALEFFKNPFSTRGSMRNMLNDLLGVGVSRGGRQAAPPGGHGELPIGRIGLATRRGATAVLTSETFDADNERGTMAQNALSYPEWDFRTNAYSRHRVLVEATEPWRADGVAATPIVSPASRSLERDVASFGLIHEMRGRQRDGADLDTEALIGCAIDLRTGHSPASLDIYRASRKTRRDLAASIVLDISGSTGEACGDGPSIFARQLQLAWQLGRTLDGLGDKVAMFGFQSWGRRLVRAVRLKDWTQRWGPPMAERFGRLEPAGYTRMGAAIRHGTFLLQSQQRCAHRLLILVTDGISFDQDYENRYAEQDTRKALAEARAQGCACVCLCVGGSVSPEQLAALFGPANILRGDDVADFAGRVGVICRDALAIASRHKSRAAGAKRGRVRSQGES